jgi:RhtB (resistance to homoserine/threonine) family protein
LVDSQILAFTGIAALLTLTPGADTMLVVRSALVGGRRAGLLTMTGICCGLFVHAALSGLGLSVVLVRSARVFEVVKLVGACYLVFLGVQALRTAARQPASVGPELPPLRARRAFLDGLLNNVLNPKVAVFYLAFLPQFIRPGDAVLARSILLAAIHFLLGIAWLSLVTLFVGRMRLALTRPRVQRAAEGVTGAALVAFGFRLALDRR